MKVKTLMKRNLAISTYDYAGVKPFLRWAGGKSKIVRVLAAFLPPPNSYHCYFEPFVGGGGLFFHLGPSKAVLSDLNEDLINCYREVSKYPCKVWEILQTYRKLDSKKFYYTIRSQRMEKLKPIERAARFIYLNKAAFNGIYRVNRQGQFNVPYGPSFNGPALPRSSVLEAASKLLKRSDLLAEDYHEVCNLAGRGDFVYLDPPYPPMNGTACFTHYTPDRFNWDDQQEISKVFQNLDRRGCLVMMSNSDRKKIRLMFQGYYMKRLKVTRWLGSNGKRFKVHELVVTNYDPFEVRRGIE